ncbi:MAG TPA: hypothetical protein VFF06_02815 [Polyangia bacterium]|nr:hypothetical protein [Polyangia bacterium]
MIRAGLAVLACVALASGAAADKPPVPVPAPVPAPQAPPPGQPRAGGTPKAPRDALVAAADEIARQVSAIRGLSIKSPIARGVLSRDEIGAKLKERIAKEYTPAEVKAESRVLKRLGLLPADSDYEKLILGLLMEQVAGFYDPFSAKLYIADWLPLEMQRPALAHEIEHALQDQHFDLKRFAQPLKDDGDRQLAHASLVEGDGTAVMLEFQAQSMGLPIDQLPEMVATIGKQMLQGGMGTTPLFDKAPAFLKETLIFPYLGGLTFIESLRRQSPWSRINDVFKDPPESTEQILHPEKYLSHEKPIKVTAGPLPSLGARKELRRDVIGELEWKILFASQLDDTLSERAAAGWGGDRLVAYADPAHPDAPPAIVTRSVWDSETDAKEAESAATKLIARLVPTPDKKAESNFTSDAAGDEWFVERHGDELIILFGVPASTHETVAAEVWKNWKVAR